MAEFTTEFFSDRGIDYIQFQFTTIWGELKEVEFPAINWESMKDGTGVDGSSLGFMATEQSDMRAVPDLDTFGVLPWDPRVGRFICDLYDNAGYPYPTDPRSILKKVLAQAKEMGIILKTRPELEWYFLNAELEPADEGTYMGTVPRDELHSLRRRITDDMLQLFAHGSPHTIHHEAGPAQHEIELSKFEALAQADNVQSGKVIAKFEAEDAELICTFMPKPFLNEAGSGLHIHEYLEDLEGNNLFAAENGISDTLRYFIGGTLQHVDAITAVLNPTTNSYKRLVPNHEAPVYKAWGVGNRTALIRVPGYESKAHIEYRAGDVAMNIYLGKALLLAAGLDGIKKKILPNTPTTKNVDHMEEAERAELGIGKLPGSLGEALDAFEKSDLVKAVLGDQFVQIYSKKKRQEIAENQVAVLNDYEHDWEVHKYLDC